MRIITVARKPLTGSVANNVLEHGTGAIHIGATRIGTETRVNPPASNKSGGVAYHMAVRGMPADAEATVASGRWPANMILEHQPECHLWDEGWGCTEGCPVAELDKESGPTGSWSPHTRPAGEEKQGTLFGLRREGNHYGDYGGGASRFYKQVSGVGSDQG